MPLLWVQLVMTGSYLKCLMSIAIAPIIGTRIVFIRSI